MNQNLRIWKISLLLLVGLFVFLYIVANTVADIYYVLTNPVAGILYEVDKNTHQTTVVDVVRGGPADRGGLKAGDVIIAFNNKPLGEGEDLAKVMRSVGVGESAELTVIREDRKLEISMVAERRLYVYTKAIFLSFLPGAVFSYALYLIGTFVFLKKIEDRPAQLFFLMVIFWALAMRDAFPEQYFGLHSILPSWFHRILLPQWPLAVGLLLHFYLVFPVEKEVFKNHHKLVLFFIYAPLVLIIPHIYSDVNQLDFGEKILQYGWGVWLTLYFFLALAVLGHSTKYSPTPHIRKQAQIMMWGTTLSLGVPLLYSFLPNLILNKLPPFAEFVALLIIMWPFTLAYVIVKHRFMDIDVIVKRSVAYALLSGFVVAAYFLFVVGVGRLVLFLTGQTSQIVTIIATLLIAALFNPVKNRIRNFVDRRFYPSRFIYREAVRSFNHSLVNVVDLQKLFHLLINFLSDTMQIRPVGILWRQQNEDNFLVHLVKGLALNQNPAFKTENKVINLLQEKKGLVDLSLLKSEPDFLSEEERNKWDLLNTELVLPLLFRNYLVGVLFLGMKSANEPYYKEDLELLETLGDQINISLENALLTEELRGQERLKKELELARRIQLSSLPQSDPQVPGLEISGVSIPAFEVGGDYYDYIDFSDGRFGVVVGDVSGKGTSAALYMSQLKGILKTASRHHQSLKDLVAEINAITFSSIESQSFITLTCAAFDLKAGKLKVVRAGHLPLIYYSAKERLCHQLVPKGIGLGLEDGIIFTKELEEVEQAYGPGDVFLFFTDGIVEARNSLGDEFEVDLLIDLLQQNGWNSAISLREKIIAHVQQFTADASQNDDMTLVVVKVNSE
jgi:sigma-B regulation protein RsbU (phosphoserine phosphatase)